MSLILDALRKLEKEKAVPERGFLVVGTRARPTRGGTWVLVALLLAGVAVVAITWKALTRSDATVAQNSEASLPHPLDAPPPAGSAPAAAPVTAAPPVTVPRAPAQSPGTRDSADVISLEVAAEAPASEISEAPASAEPAAKPSPTPAYQLQAISSRDGKPVAILSGRLVYEGDRFEDVHVLRIGDMDVEVEVAGVRETLRFFAE